MERAVAGFSRFSGTKTALSGCRHQIKLGVAEMGVGDQFACASVVAAFSIALFLSANLFVESRAAKSVTMMPVAQQMRIVPL
jgi:hypothetical protein